MTEINVEDLKKAIFDLNGISPFDEKMTRLTAELYDLFSKSHDLEKKIRKNLRTIGFGE